MVSLVMIPEWGLWRTKDGKGGMDNPYFVQQMFNLIYDPANNVYEAAYWDSREAKAINSTIVMKRASPGDVQQLVTMMEEFYAESGYSLNHQHATQAFATLLADDRLGGVWFIQADGEDVGYVVLTLCYSMEYGGLSAFVDDLFVRLAFRGAGLGTAALQEVRAFCVEQGIRAIHVETGQDNMAAQTVYRRVGFTPTDRQLLSLRLANPTHEMTD